MEKRDKYRETLKAASDRIIIAQKPVRILSSIAWPGWIKKKFLASMGRELPVYDYPPLKFNPSKKIEEFQEIMAMLDPRDDLMRILYDTCQQYIEVIEMVAARGTRKFYEISRGLYGSPSDSFLDNRTTNLELARHLDCVLDVETDERIGPPMKNDISAERAVRILNKRFRRYFPREEIRVVLSRDITSEASAGAKKLKLKKGRMFNMRTLQYLEHHEGYIHIGTTINGEKQTLLKFLSKATPRSVKYNEGLAVFEEWVSKKLTVGRLQKLKDRTIGIHMAEEGADFVDLYQHFLTKGNYNEHEAFDLCRRVFRGGDVHGRYPFTKDCSYLEYFLRIYNFIRVALKLNIFHYIDFLFAGKVTIEDLPILYRHYESGEISFPYYLPPWVRDKRWLASHMSISSFLNLVDLSAVEKYYEEHFRIHGVS
ncbi:MAG: flavohemoglobin expression-modulating QEGLA motif protein [Acidobacteriota bacterium]